MCCLEGCSETQECLKRGNTGKEKRAHRKGGVPEKKRNGKSCQKCHIPAPLKGSTSIYVGVPPPIYIWHSLPQGYPASLSGANEHRMIAGHRRISKFV